MQSLYKIIKSPVTEGNEIISLPDIRAMLEKKAKEDVSLENESISKVHDEILLNARKRAEMIVNEAEASADRIIEDAKINAEKLLKDARDDGYQQGYRQGYNEGYQFGINEANSEANEIRKNADIYIESCRTEAETYIKNKHEEIIQLALAIARQVIHGEVIINPEMACKIAEDVLSKATDRKHVILKVNPADFNIVKNKKEDLAIYVENPNNLFIIADSGVTQGSVKAETPSGFIDGAIETQLDMISKLLLRD